MGQSLAVLGVLVAVLAAMLRGDVPSAQALRQARIDRAIQKGISGLKTKPRVKILKIRVRKSDPDNSNTSYAALGIRSSLLPAEAPGWMHRTGGRLERAIDAARFTLKDLARKSILGRISS